MSVNVNWSQIKNWRDLVIAGSHGQHTALATHIAILLPIIGIGKIDDETIGEFCARLVLLQRLYGGMGPSDRPLSEGGDYLTWQDVERFHGLTSNVFYTPTTRKGLQTYVEPRAKWLKRTVDYGYLTEQVRNVQRELEVHQNNLAKLAVLASLDVRG